MIEAGLPSIMTAHTAYPALDASGLPATLSKAILTDFLKGDLGFEGVITTDDITMGGIVEKYEVHEACIMAINAGADLILFRDESVLIDEVFPKVVGAAKSGVISEERLNDAVRRTLSVKVEYGFFDNKVLKDPLKAGEGIKDSKVKEIAKQLAKETVKFYRDKDHVLPLKKEDHILLIEQIHPLHKMVNEQDCHPGLLWEKMLDYSDAVSLVEVSLDFDDDSRKRMIARMDKADVIVMTHYYFRGVHKENDLIKEVMASGKPLVLITNSPYEYAAPRGCGTIILNYGASPESFEEVAMKLFDCVN